MAIIFTKDIDSNKLNLAFNNTVVKWYSDNVLAQSKCVVTIGANTLTLYPDPFGFFTYNFKTIISTLLNSDNFKDDLITDLDTSFAYDWTSKIYLNTDIDFTITFENDTTETVIKNTHWLSGYVQLRDYKTTYPVNNLLSTNTILLQKQINNTYSNFYVNYWAGYPFDLTFFGKTGTLTVLNKTNAISQSFASYDVTRFVFSDGRTDVSIEDEIPLVTGFNDVYFNNDFNVEIQKITDFCKGTYLKWINSLGGWNYWLFSKGNESKNTKDLGFLINENENLEDSVSPLISLGKSSNTTLSLTQRLVTNESMSYLSDLLDSAKVYLFTGEPFSKNTFNDWVEVNLKSGRFIVAKEKQNLFNLDLEIELPSNTTRSL